jgi:hypothetical protein
MQGIQKAMAAMMRASRAFRAARLAAALGGAVLAAGCSTAIQTPLPDLKPAASTSLTQAEKNKAMTDLTHKAQTHTQDAEQQIEQAR